MIDPITARALGVRRDQSAEVIARALLRCGGIEPLADDLPRHIADWFAVLADELGQNDSADLERSARVAADEAMIRLPVHLALGVLAVLGPEVIVPKRAAKDLSAECRKRVRALLPSFCATVLRDWRGDLAAVDEIPDDDDPVIRPRPRR